MISARISSEPLRPCTEIFSLDKKKQQRCLREDDEQVQRVEESKEKDDEECFAQHQEQHMEEIKELLLDYHGPFIGPRSLPRDP